MKRGERDCDFLGPPGPVELNWDRSVERVAEALSTGLCKECVETQPASLS